MTDLATTTSFTRTRLFYHYRQYKYSPNLETTSANIRKACRGTFPWKNTKSVLTFQLRSNVSSRQLRVLSDVSKLRVSTGPQCRFPGHQPEVIRTVVAQTNCMHFQTLSEQGNYPNFEIFAEHRTQYQTEFLALRNTILTQEAMWEQGSCPNKENNIGKGNYQNFETLSEHSKLSEFWNTILPHEIHKLPSVPTYRFHRHWKAEHTNYTHAHTKFKPLSKHLFL